MTTSRAVQEIEQMAPQLAALRLRAVSRDRGSVRSRIVRTTPQQIHRIGQNLRRIAFVVVLVHPLAGAETPLDIDLRALPNVAVDHIGQTTPQRDRMPFGVFLRLVRLTVVQPLGRRQTHARHLRAPLQRADLRVHAHVADQDYLVYHYFSSLIIRLKSCSIFTPAFRP